MGIRSMEPRQAAETSPITWIATMGNTTARVMQTSGSNSERVGHELGKGEDLSGGDAGEVNHAKGDRNHHANDRAKEHGAQPERALAKVGERKDHGEGDKSDAPGLRVPPSSVPIPPAMYLDGRGIGERRQWRR